MFYRKCYADQIEHNSQYDPKSAMHPGQLSGTCIYAQNEYKIHVSDLEFSGRMNRDHIANGFEHLQSLQIPFGILTVDDTV